MPSFDFQNLRYLESWLKLNGLKKEAYLIRKISRLEKYAVSEIEIKSLKKWLNSSESRLSFNDIFAGKLRIVIPFNTKEQRKLIEIISFLKDNGWGPSGGNNFFDVIKTKQKLRKLHTGEEYEEEVEVADLKVSKSEKRIIPYGPKKGEEAISKSTTTISKVLVNPKNNAPEWMSEWWQKKQSEYVKNYNWNQIETIFQYGKSFSKNSIIISRNPIDILRMSDHKNISSCHSEGDSYFECAVAESKGNGLVAYLVETDELNKLFTPHDPWYRGTTNEKIDISDLDNQEIFADPEREIMGIEPKSRIRLRKYVNNEMDYEFTVPEHRTYGPCPPGFKELVRSWAWEQQKHLFINENKDISLPELNNLEMHGGSYRDTSDGEILNSFFNEGGLNSNFHGNAETISENEQNVYKMWEDEISEINERANSELEHALFFAEVGQEDGLPYVLVSAIMRCEILLSGWDEIYIEDNYAKTKSGFEDIPIRSNEWIFKDLKNLLNDSDLIDGDLDNIDVSIEEGTLTFDIYFPGNNCTNPDDANNFLSFIKTDIDANYDEYMEKVRKKLMSEGYIGETEYDKAVERFESIEFQNFNVIIPAENDYDGETRITSKDGSIPLGLKIPNMANIESNISNISSVLNIRNTIQKIFNTNKPFAASIFQLKDEPLIIVNILNKIAKESYEFEKKQLHLPLYKEDNSYKENEFINFSEVVKNLETSIKIYDNTVTELIINIVLRVKDSGEHLLFLEKFVDLLDKNLSTIGNLIAYSLNNKIQVAVANDNAISKSFFNGDLMRSVTKTLKGSHYNPDIMRLALWVEKNWNNFSKDEKEVAYYRYLLPVENGSYIYKDDSGDVPRFWNDNILQNRKDTSTRYSWKGISMKDVMPYIDPNVPIYTEPEIPIKEDLKDEESNILENKLESLSSWLIQNKIIKEANILNSILKIIT